MPIRIVLSQGQSSDKTIAPVVLERLAPDRDLIADRGYDDAARSLIWSKAAAAELTSRPAGDRKVQRSVDPVLYRQRHLIERFLNKLKRFRRIALRQTARTFLAAVTPAASRLWIRFETTNEPRAR